MVLEINNETDIVRIRIMAKIKAAEMGFGLVDQTRICTAVSELARNVFVHAGKGKVVIEEDCHPNYGMRITFTDEGPGIEDIELAMQDGFSTAGSLGKGLPGTKRLTDKMEIFSERGRGTTVIVEKWLRKG
jgi:serine/threonine-protein kinase RsbT